MGAIDGVPLLIRAAEVTARKFYESVSELHNLTDEQSGQTVFVNQLRLATIQIEIAAVGVFSLFEARIQPHFQDGPVFEALRAHLNKEGQSELANDVEYYHLAVNVLKHGMGSSYNKLLEAPNLPFAIKKKGVPFFDEGDVAEPEGLINVTATGFFEGLISTLSRTHKFL